VGASPHRRAEAATTELGGEVRRCRVRGAGGTKREGGGGGWVSAHGRTVVTHDTLRLGHVRTSLACVG
jgi:hypothetical protein